MMYCTGSPSTRRETILRSSVCCPVVSSVSGCAEMNAWSHSRVCISNNSASRLSMRMAASVSVSRIVIRPRIAGSRLFACGGWRRRGKHDLGFLEDQEVILTVVLGEVVSPHLMEAGAFHFFTKNFFVEAVVGAGAVAVDDAEARAGLHRGTQRGEHEFRVRDLVVDLQHQHGVDAVLWQLRVVGCAEDRLDVAEVFVVGALADGVDVLRIDVFGEHCAGGADASCGENGEPAATCAYVRDRFAGCDVQQIHHAVDVQAFGAAGALKDTEVAGVGSTGGMLRWSDLRLDHATDRCERESANEESCGDKRTVSHTPLDAFNSNQSHRSSAVLSINSPSFLFYQFLISSLRLPYARLT